MNFTYIGKTEGISPIKERDEKFLHDLYFTDNSTDNLKNQLSKLSYHYEVPNMSSMLYEFTNREQEKIHQSFRTGNYVSLRDMPDMIIPGNVTSMLSSKIEDNLFSIMERRSYVELSNNGGYFSKFEWQPDDYNNFKEKISSERRSNVEKQRQLHGPSPFLYNP